MEEHLYMNPNGALVEEEDGNVLVEEQEGITSPAFPAAATATHSGEGCQPWIMWNSMIHACYPILLLLMVFVLWPLGYWSFQELLPSKSSYPKRIQRFILQFRVPLAMMHKKRLPESFQ